MLASLDHAIWFHRRFRADDWLLYAQDSPSSGGGRAFCRGTLFTRDGRAGGLDGSGRAAARASASELTPIS